MRPKLPFRPRWATPSPIAQHAAANKEPAMPQPITRAYPLLITPEFRAALDSLYPDGGLEAVVSTPIGAHDERIVSLAIVDEPAFESLRAMVQDGLRDVSVRLASDESETRLGWWPETCAQDVLNRLARALRQAERNPIMAVGA